VERYAEFAQYGVGVPSSLLRAGPRPQGFVERHDFSRAVSNTNPPDRAKSTSPAHFSFSNSSAARSIISQVMESFSILTLP
jgi:hypothetical protein